MTNETLGDSEFTGRAILLFDGVCNLCNSAVAFIIDRDPEGHFLFAPLQSELGRTLVANCALDPDQLDSLVLVEDGICYRKSTAALRIATRLRGGWRMAGIFKVIPRALRDPVYDIIARHRYRWFGKRESCRIATSDEQSRFLA